MDRAVERGLEHRESQIVSHICVDETSFRKGHKYITVVSDETSGKVLYVGIGRTKKVLKNWYMGLPPPEQLAGIQSVSMDMWPAHIYATLACVPDAENKIGFDRFHGPSEEGFGGQFFLCSFSYMFSVWTVF